jgi:nucleotide-binding universal stress UspA family protein
MTVIVSIYSSAGTIAAIQLAAREARYRDCLLVAVTSYSGENARGGAAARPPATQRTPAEEPQRTPEEATQRTPAEEEVEAETMLRDAVDDALGDEAVKVERRVVRGLAGRRFVEAAREADAELIVLAARGSMSFLLGAVSQYVLRHAPCPVLVVPEGSNDS